MKILEIIDPVFPTQSVSLYEKNFSDESAVDGVGAIHIDEINPTLIPLEKELGIDLRNNALGSVGKREFSGDIDVALKIATDDLPTFIKKLENSPQILGVEKSSIIMTKVKISNFDKSKTDGRPRTGYVQVDFMPGDPEWMKTYYHSPHEKDSKYKGAYRNILIASIAGQYKVVNSAETIEDGRAEASERFMFSPRDGLVRVRRTPVPKKTGEGFTKKNSNKIIGGPWKSANDIATNLGLDNGEDLYSYETLVNAIKKNMSEKEQSDILTAFVDNHTIQSMGIPPDIKEYAS